MNRLIGYGLGCLVLSGCVQSVPAPLAPPPGALATQSDTIGLENTDRIARFQRLATMSDTTPPVVDQLEAPSGTVPGVSGPVPVVRVVFAEDAFFDSGSAEPRAEAGPILDLIAENMKRDVPDAALTLLGHTDATGSVALNMTLSRQRAAAVMAGLIERGVPPSQLSTVAIGAAQPIAPNRTAAGRARNRRVEFMIAGSQAANLSVVTHRFVNANDLRLAAARPPVREPEQVALLVPTRAPARIGDLSFLQQTAALSLPAPSFIEPPSETTPGQGRAPGLVEPPAEKG